MLHLFEPVADASTTGRFRRNPAIPVLIAVATGIVWDRMRPIPLQGWWLATFTMVLVSLGCRVFKGRFSVALLLMGCLGLGGLWHHWCWSCLAANDISRWAVDQGRIVHLTGKVVQAPLFIKSSGQGDAPWTAPERTVTLIECRRLIGRSSGSHEITGRARLSIIGRAESLKIGNLIDISGVLIRPDEPSNPGEFDFRRWMRAQGLHVTIAANFPEAIVVTGQECLAIDRVTMVRSAVRQRAERLMTSCLKPRTAAVAQSLLLGSRVELDRELRQAFAESGTLHVLAISGMNVGLLWCWMSFLCRMLRIPDRASLVCVLLLLPAYALVTDANPPVVRATIVAMVMAFGQSIRRCGSHWNSLALAALLVLGWNPSDLFNSGAQLSFVAVAAILLTMSFLRSVRMAVESEERPESVNSIGWNVTTWFFRKNLEAIIVSLGVWVMTSPLIAAQFHLVSPIGSALNVVLSPLIAVMFCLGYSFLLLGLISPQLFGWLGAPFEFTLEWFLAAVQTAAGWELGHNYVPAPPLWWTLGFYLIAFSTILLDHRRGRLFWSTRAVLAWSVFGLTFILSPAKSNGLRVTVCSVGHGLSVLIETPRGKTILYDAGGMAGGTRAARTVEGVLWSSGYSRLDAILISHADADHCNAVPELTGVSMV